MVEIFKDVPNYEGIYQVSNLGRVKSLTRQIIHSNGRIDNINEKIRKHYSNKKYSMMVLSKNGINKTFTVHKLVAITFLSYINNFNKDLVIDHINNIKTDNRLDNLQLITQRENCAKDLKNNYSKYVGVSRDKYTKVWRARIFINNKSKHLGCFLTELEAHKAYQKELKKINNEQ